MNAAQQLYISLLHADGYEDQVPEYIAARVWHLLWLLIPVIGFLIFVEWVRFRYQTVK